ncbi:MAG: hypothetical protein WAT39_07385 [Planctomycetota bacterium]
MLERLLAFGARAEFATARRRLHRSLFAELSDRQAEALERSRKDELQIAIMYFLHTDLPCHRGDSLGEILLRRDGATMPARQRSALANMVGHPTSLYEIVDVFPGKGLELRDLLRWFRVRVRERSASTMVEPGWLLLTRVRPQPDGTPVIDMPMLHFDDDLRPAVDDWLAQRRTVDATTGIEPRSVLVELYRIWQVAMATALTKPTPELRLQNQHGEPLELCAAELRCDGRRLRAWLAQASDWEPDEDGEGEDTDDEVHGADEEGPGSWVWFESLSGGARRSLGRLEIAGDHCLLHVNSRARLDRAVARLHEAAGAVLLGVEATSVGELMARAKASKGARSEADESEIPREVQAEVLHKTMDSHYRRWIDEPIPMFGGRTPRAMAKIDPGAVSKAIWEICNGSPGVRYDASWMYAELDLKALGQGEFTPGFGAE